MQNFVNEAVYTAMDQARDTLVKYFQGNAGLGRVYISLKGIEATTRIALEKPEAAPRVFNEIHELTSRLRKWTGKMEVQSAHEIRRIDLKALVELKKRLESYLTAHKREQNGR